MSEDDNATTQRRAPRGPAAHEADAAEALFRVGDLIANKYRVEHVLGAGGMGVVLAVRHLQLGEPFALKFLRREALDAASVERFLREARAAVRIKSEHVVHVSDVGQLSNGAPYIVMEHLSGCDLAQLISEKAPLPIQVAVSYLIQACAGIGEAHANGIVHRDLKPSNLFLTTRSDGAPLVKVLDFGISKLEAAGSSAITATHDVFGSPAYMPPEQIRSAKNVDARSDVWALGVILHELLTGTLPFDGETPAALLAAVSADAPRSMRAARPEIDPALDAIVQRCLQKPPAARFSSVAELAVALAPFALEDEAMLARRAVRRPSVMPSFPAPAPAPSSAAAFAATEKRNPARPNRLAGAILASVVVAVLAGIGLAVHLRGEKDPVHGRGLPAGAPSSTSNVAIVDANPSAAVPADPSGVQTSHHASASSVGGMNSAAPRSPRAKPHASGTNDSKTASPSTGASATKAEPNGATETSH